MKKTILIDFDGVLHQYTSGWQGINCVADPPVIGAFEMLNKYLDYFEVFIYSTRCESEEGTDAIRKWFRFHNFERLHELQYTYWKQPAWLIIDDRAFHFRGIFPAPEEIANFKPWNKK